jgi:hypothetical protein
MARKKQRGPCALCLKDKSCEKAGGDVFVLARIAGHSSISVTQRYIHPQADAINRVFGVAVIYQDVVPGGIARLMGGA